MKYRVLIADDNQLLATMISQILTDVNIDNEIVFSGEDVMRVYNQSYFDMVLIDIMMPNKNGIEVSKEIRKSNATVPIVALTALPYEDIKDQLAEAGINQYISKPPKMEDLKILLLEYFQNAA